MYEFTEDSIWDLLKHRLAKCFGKLIHNINERLENMVTKNQFAQGLKLLKDAQAKQIKVLQDQITALQNAPAIQDDTDEATQVLVAANAIDPTISTDPTLLPDVPINGTGATAVGGGTDPIPVSP